MASIGSVGEDPNFKFQISNPDFKSQISNQLCRTLDAMADGGIRDHLGGGFHRYSTDDHWLVPHFEIMLYDNAMLGWIYAEAYRQFGTARYAQIARGIFDFVLREMTDSGGGFYTAFDAEVDAQEGLSYLWTKEQIESILGQPDAQVFSGVYGVDLGPNFADPHHGSGIPNKNILYLPQPLETAAAEMKQSAHPLESRLRPMRQKLYEARRLRKQPLLDTKIITSWNALMIRALAHGGKVLNEPRYVSGAAAAAEFLYAKHWNDQVLYRTSRDGVAKHRGFLDDYAFLAQAFLALQAATDDDRWRQKARSIALSMVQQFADEKKGGLYFTDEQATDLIVRQKTAQDSPLPSGNAIAAMVLLELNQQPEALGILQEFAQQIAEHGVCLGWLVVAAMNYLKKEGPFAVSPARERDVDRPATPQQIAAGVVEVVGEWMSAAELHLALRILDGFHINANASSGEIPLIPTKIVVETTGATVEYPPGEEQGVCVLRRGQFRFMQRKLR